VQDIATVRPHLIVPEGYLDLLMASPTCTHHSVARGGKPTSDQQRSDPWHIITWLTELRVKRIIIENVWEFTGWGPVDPKTGKPIKDREGRVLLRLDRDAAAPGLRSGVAQAERRRLRRRDHPPAVHPDGPQRPPPGPLADADARQAAGRRAWRCSRP
jgi:site-specific DNA-cytosine methylase